MFPRRKECGKAEDPRIPFGRMHDKTYSFDRKKRTNATREYWNEYSVARNRGIFAGKGVDEF